ncbi:TetR/AcrR family transcriptional regulator [Rhodopila sp.]|uniref:TetR/AcrR family transcriptional regulator n=1 Tax=Rhodopila sp. TaxID=2480087 RepID=UPI003D0EDA42
MARPREFDETTVLEAAMNCFWAQGYEATSVRDLASEMGITGASLYNAFGDKRSLYRRALQHYFEQSIHDRISRFDQLPSFAAIRAFFDEIIERSVMDKVRRGCFLVNSALEMAPSDPEFRKLVASEMTFLEAFFRRCVVAGQMDRTIAALQPADDLARLLLSLLFGVRVLARTQPQREVLEGAVNGALGLLKIGLTKTDV